MDLQFTAVLPCVSWTGMWRATLELISASVCSPEYKSGALVNAAKEWNGNDYITHMYSRAYSAA